MLRPRARVGNTADAVPLPALVTGVLLALLLAVSGCGSSGSGSDKPSKAAVACRAKWKDLEPQVDGRDTKTNPSDLATRWNTIVATVEYHATSATGQDCRDTIEAQKKAMDDLTAFSAKLAPYDMELRLEQVKAAAEAYAAAPRPPAPKPSPTKKGKKAKKSKKPVPNPAPKPADVAAALKALTKQAPLATKQQDPAWQQARVAELSDAAAVAKSVKDLAFLSSESPAYTEARWALTTIKKAQAYKG